jgi:hypothetical protein
MQGLENLTKRINIGLGKFGKNNERRALNIHRKLENIHSPWISNI